MEKSNSLISSYIGISFVICTMNSYVQVIGDRTIGLEWRTQRGVIVNLDWKVDGVKNGGS